MDHPFSTIRVLIVDDNRDELHILSDRLPAERFEVVTTTSPDEALAIYRRVCLDLVLIDYHMAETSGIEVLRSFRAECAHTALAIMTGRTEASRITIDAAREGASGFIRKAQIYDDFPAFADTLRSLVVPTAGRVAGSPTTSDSRAVRDLLLMAALIRRSTVEAAAKDARMSPELAYARITDPGFRMRLEAFDDDGANPVARLVEAALRPD